MSDMGNRSDRGTHAYRWLVLLSLGVLGVLSMRVLNQLDRAIDRQDTSDKLVIGMNSTLETAKVKIDRASDKVEVLQNQVTEVRGVIDGLKATIGNVQQGNQKNDQRIEEMQRQIWQRRTP